MLVGPGDLDVDVLVMVLHEDGLVAKEKDPTVLLTIHQQSLVISVPVSLQPDCSGLAVFHDSPDDEGVEVKLVLDSDGGLADLKE